MEMHLSGWLWLSVFFSLLDVFNFLLKKKVFTKCRRATNEILLICIAHTPQYSMSFVRFVASFHCSFFLYFSDVIHFLFEYHICILFCVVSSSLALFAVHLLLSGNLFHSLLLIYYNFLNTHRSNLISVLCIVYIYQKGYSIHINIVCIQIYVYGGFVLGMMFV